MSIDLGDHKKILIFESSAGITPNSENPNQWFYLSKKFLRKFLFQFFQSSKKCFLFHISSFLFNE